MVIIISFFLILIAAVSGLVLIYSPGKPNPVSDENGKPVKGGISEKIFVSINDTEQGMFIQSRNINNPVLLYLHGGLPEYFLNQKYPSGIEKYFTVAWWEQRGSGISYKTSSLAKEITLTQLIGDVLEVTNYLRERFGKEKIYLMAHSGGTFIGIQAASQFPDLYHAYLGMSQMTNQLLSEKLAWDYMCAQFKEKGNKKMVRKLKAAPVNREKGTPAAYLAIRDKAMHQLGVGTMHNMHSVITGIFLPSLRCSGYTLKEKYYLWHGKSQSGVSSLWDEMLSADLTVELTELKLPVYFFEGIYDYTCSYLLAIAYFEILKAPVKRFYTFENSAHSPLFEEPEKMLQILKTDVLNLTESVS